MTQKLREYATELKKYGIRPMYESPIGHKIICYDDTLHSYFSITDETDDAMQKNCVFVAFDILTISFHKYVYSTQELLELRDKVVSLFVNDLTMYSIIDFKSIDNNFAKVPVA